MLDRDRQSIEDMLLAARKARRLSQEARNGHPATPWRDITGMRSIVSHGYDRVDDEELWQVIARDLPALIVQLEAILATP